MFSLPSSSGGGNGGKSRPNTRQRSGVLERVSYFDEGEDVLLHPENIESVLLNQQINMDARSNCEDALRQFKMIELQTLLTAFNIPKNGKKSELQQRARKLLMEGNAQLVINKIREIQRTSNPGSVYASGSDSNYHAAPPAHRNYLTPSSASVGPSHPSFAMASTTAHQQPSAAVRNTQQFLTSHGASSSGYGSSLSSSSNALGRSTVTNGRLPSFNRAQALRTVDLPFYDLIDTILSPTEITPQSHSSNGRQFFNTFSFYVPLSHRTALNSRSEQLPRIQLQLRVFLLDMSKPQKDDFPFNISVKVDDRDVTLPAVIPTNKPNVETKRLSRPVDITLSCQPVRCKDDRNSHPHQLQIGWQAFNKEDNRCWAISIRVVKQVTTGILLKRLLNNCNVRQPAQKTKAAIARRLDKRNDNDDITTDNVRVSLLCPLMKRRMSVPCRPRDCDHLQCFDLNNFLQMNERRPNWSCPVCSKSAHYNELIIDGYFDDALKNTPSSVREIELLSQGDWKMFKEELDSDDETAGAGNTASATRCSKNSGKRETAETATDRVAINKVITKPAPSDPDDSIIILSDSDDDLPTSSKQPAASSSASTHQQTTKDGGRAPQVKPCTSASPAHSEGSSSSSIVLIEIADSPPSRSSTTETMRTVSNPSTNPGSVDPPNNPPTPFNGYQGLLQRVSSSSPSTSNSQCSSSNGVIRQAGRPPDGAPAPKRPSHTPAAAAAAAVIAPATTLPPESAVTSSWFTGRPPHSDQWPVSSGLTLPTRQQYSFMPPISTMPQSSAQTTNHFTSTMADVRQQYPTPTSSASWNNGGTTGGWGVLGQGGNDNMTQNFGFMDPLTQQQVTNNFTTFLQTNGLLDAFYQGRNA